MTGLLFETQSSITSSAPNRADIACFVGFVNRRQEATLPTTIQRWLEEQGWAAPPYARPSSPLNNLLDLPVPLESWEMFDRLFAWEQRVFLHKNEQTLVGLTYLGAAVRSFFAQGGSKCYVIRVGDPWLASLPREQRIDQLANLIPGYPNRVIASAVDRRTWSGVWHLFGLPDVSFVCLPDLADIVSVNLSQIDTEQPDVPTRPEQFVECSQPVPKSPRDDAVRFLRAPRCDETGYQIWAKAVQLIADLIASRQRAHHLREVQFVTAVPLPQTNLIANRDLLAFLSAPGRGFLTHHPSSNQHGIASAFVQLAYPWVRTPGSSKLPEQLESPDAVLVGILARNALTRGAFRSAANLHLADVQDVVPQLGQEQLRQLHPDTARPQSAKHTLRERVSLLGRTPSGLRLLSDVTTSLSKAYRPASVNRLTSAIVRAARRLGEDIGFEPASERLALRLRTSLNSLLLGLWQAGALQGNTPAEAFEVRCDRTTMTQDDIDNGRIIAQIQFAAALPIEQITVTLVMNEGGQISQIATEAL